MGKYIRLGLGLMAGLAAGIAVYGIIRRRRMVLETRPPFAEAAENGEA